MNGIEAERRAGLATERKGEVSTLCSIHLDTPSPAPAFHSKEETFGGHGEISIRGKESLTDVFTHIYTTIKLYTKQIYEFLF
jgi:hypothetical protein